MFQVGDMRSSDLKTGSHLTLSLTSSVSPLLELFRRGNNSRSAFGAMRHRESAAGLHARDLKETTPKGQRRTPVPNKNSERGEKPRVLRFIAMMSPASGERPGPATQPGKIGESLVNRADLSLLKIWFVPRRPSVRTSSSRPSGYARSFRFAKEFGPDQVLRSDSPVGNHAPFSASGRRNRESDRGRPKPAQGRESSSSSGKWMVLSLPKSHRGGRPARNQSRSR